jgi:PKD repeat protein
VRRTGWATIVIVAAAALALVGSPGPAGALPSTSQPVLELNRLIETSPFVGSSVSVRDNEGNAYISADNALWLVSDNDREAFEMDATTGALRRIVTQSEFASSPRFGVGGTAGNGRSDDLESLAYDAAADTLYAFSGVSGSDPTVYRMTRDGGGAFQVDSWQPLGSTADFTGAGWRPTDDTLYVVQGSTFHTYDYAANAVGPGFSINGVSQPLGLDFASDGDLLAVTHDQRLLRVDFGARSVRPGWDLDLTPFGILDSRGVSVVGNQLFVSDGYDFRSSGDPMSHAVFVFDVSGGGGPAPPVASFTVSTTAGVAPLTVSFTDTSTGSPDSWSWDFGDGSGSTEPSPTHVFAAPGDYTVTLTVANGAGSGAASTVIHSTEAPLGGAAVADSYVSSTRTTKNYGSSTDLKLRAASPAYHPYLRLSVGGLSGPPDSATLRLYVTNGSPSGGDWYRVDDSWSEGTVNWANAPALAGAPFATVGQVSSGQWVDIDVTGQVTGNGSYSFAAASPSTNTARFASRESTHPPQLVIAPASGPVTPTASFTTSTTAGIAPLAVSFTDTSTGGPTSWSWDFGDGSGSAMPSPAHTFTAPGAYPVSLTVTNDQGSDTAGTVITVDAAPQVVTMTPVADSYVSISRPTKNYGSYTELKLLGPSGQYEYHPYFQFSVSGLTGAPSSVVLRLFVTDSGASGGTWYRVGDAWTETGITWDNAPPLVGTPITTVGAVTAGQWIDIDVTPLVTGDGVYSFAASTTATGTVKFSGREGSEPAQLVITR